MTNREGYGEQAYLDMLTRIMRDGVDKTDRTGTGTREVFCNLLRFDLSKGEFPVFTTKQVGWKTAFKEMLWMLSGSGNIRPLLEQDVHIWTEWPHDRYVKTTGDAIGLKEFEARILGDDAFASVWGNTGGAYGVQWRHWPTYNPQVGGPNGTFVRGDDIDQIQVVIDTIKKSPDSRRIIFTAWNVQHLGEMMLPPCHMTYQFQIADGKVNLTCEIRSWDTFLGGPFNCAGAGMILRMMAMHTGLEPGELVMFSVCTHIYKNHFDAVREQLERTPTALPSLTIAPRASFFDHRIEDFTLNGYSHQGKISAPVAV